MLRQIFLQRSLLIEIESIHDICIPKRLSRVIRYLILSLGKIKDLSLQFLQSFIARFSFWDWKSEGLWVYFTYCAFHFLFWLFEFEHVFRRWSRKSTCVSWVCRFLRLLHVFRSISFFLRFASCIMWRRILLLKFNHRMYLLHLLHWASLSCCHWAFIEAFFCIPLRQLKLFILHWREFLDDNTR